MEFNFPSCDRNNHWSFYYNRWYCSRDSNNPFFSESPKRREERKNAHHNNLINVYLQWYATSPNFVNLRVIDIPDSDLAYIENFLNLNFRDDGSSKDLRTSEEMALSHLKDKQYKAVYDKYTELLNFQNVFNKKREDFIDSNINELKNKLGLNEIDEQKLYDLLEYYFVKVDDVIEWLDNPQSVHYRMSHLEPMFDSSGKIFSIPFPEKIDIIREDIFSRYTRIIKVKDELNEDLVEFIGMIENFRNSLKPIIDNGILGIKGKCSIEEHLSLKGSFKSFLHLPC